MNKERRKKIAGIISMIDNASSIAEEVAAEEQDALDNLPEAIADSDIGMRMEENIDDLEDAISDLESARDKLESIVN